MSFIVKAGVIKSSSHLQKSINYIFNPDKTEGLICTNCSPPGTVPEAKQVYQEFALTKKLHPSRGSREGYHYKISFSKDETISPEDALQFVRDFAEEYLDGNYDYAASVHTDRDHLHMHLVFNSTARTGGKFRFNKSHWQEQIKPLAKKLADRYHTGPLKEKDPTLDYTPGYDKPATQHTDMSWREVVEEDIRNCMDKSKSYKQFKYRLRTDYGYKLREGVSKQHGLYLSLTPPGKAKAIRTYQLSEVCQPEAIAKELASRKQGVYTAMDGSYQLFTSKHFVPYREMTYTEKENVRKMMAAKQLYKRTGASLQQHERSVRQLRKMQAQAKNYGCTRRQKRSISGNRYYLQAPGETKIQDRSQDK